MSAHGTRAEGLDELLRVVQRDGSQSAVLEWLGRRIGADVAWIGPRGGIDAATPAFPDTVVAALPEHLERLADGRLGAAATRLGTLEIHLEAFGPRAPRRPVLVTVGANPLTREAASLASQAGGLLRLLGAASAAADRNRAYQCKARDVRFAVLTALMGGDLTLARRITCRDVPPLLDAEYVRVHLLQCTPTDRDRLAEAYQDGSGYHGSGLMVHCPAFRDHLICPIPDTPDPPGDRLRGGQELRRLVDDHPGYFLGVSRPHPLTDLGAAYGEALHALAVARNSPERVAVYEGRPSLAGVLPRPAGTAWALSRTAPLRNEPKLTGDIVRLAVTFPRAAVARLLSISRTTVAAHCRRAERVLGPGRRPRPRRTRPGPRPRGPPARSRARRSSATGLPGTAQHHTSDRMGGSVPPPAS
ncbi:PucR family transcriptional regulator [Streptomyces djakartensis]|uniref:PucR family transcriptional regulator n=1 Tax=Streptomyces djakartensis TaxID=68193 RepID=UPI00167DB843|nr:PucR family transcriptional regulator [Streptomyces djakartensis]